MEYLILTVIVCIVYIIYVYFKYNEDAIPSERYDLYREKLDILPAEAGYLINKDCENADLILANILTLVNEEYIDMELIGEDYVFSKTEKTDFNNLKSHQVLAYNLFFKDKEQITLNYFFENIKFDKEQNANAEVKYHSIKVLLDNEFENMGITDVKAKKKMRKINSFSLKLIFIIPIVFLFNFFYEAVVSSNWITSAILCIIEIFSIVLYVVTNSDEDKITLLGANLKEKSLAFKRFLEEHTIMDDKPFYMVNILDYNYTTAIAMGLADMANKRFSKKYVKNIKAKRSTNNVNWKSVIFLLIIVILIIAVEQKEIVSDEVTMETNKMNTYNYENFKINIPENYKGKKLTEVLEVFNSDDYLRSVYIWNDNFIFLQRYRGFTQEEFEEFVLNLSNTDEIISQTKEQIGKNQAIKIRTKNETNLYYDIYILTEKQNFILLMFLGNSAEDLDNIEYQNIKDSFEITENNRFYNY